jgi:hypothetical protein
MDERALLNYLHKFILPSQTVTSGSWVIAGGYVRDKLLKREPRDIDCFYLVDDLGDVAATAATALSRISELGLPYSHQEVGGKSIIAIDYLGSQVHLVVRKANSPDDLVSKFDFNICRFFLDEDFEARAVEASDIEDLMHGLMRLNHVETPLASLRRGFIFQHRLGFKFHKSDIQWLVETLAEKGIYDRESYF